MTSLVFDPRLRARRIAVRRAQGRRRLRRLLTLGILFATALIALGVSRSFLFDVDEIGVSGADRSSSERIIEASGISPGDQLTDLDLEQARRSVHALPWVDSVSIERDWWGSVTIDVVERQPVAAVADQAGRWWLVDGDAKLLAPVAEPDPRFVRVEGLTVTGEAGSGVGDTRALPAVLAALDFPDDLLTRTDLFLVTDDGDIELQVRTEAPGEVATVLFGAPIGIPDKALALRTILTRVEPDCLRAIDVRVPASPVVKRWPQVVSPDSDTVVCERD